MLFSATFPPLIQRLSKDILKSNNVFISNTKLVSANSRVLQKFIPVIYENKKSELLKLLKKEIEDATAKNRKENRYRSLLTQQPFASKRIFSLFRKKI